MKPFRFGVNVGPSRSRAEWVEKARRLEALGYNALTVPDHLADFLAPMPALVSAAEATTTLRVGTNVLNNDFRHPVLVAREAATVDLLTDGRLILGLGAGYMRSEYEEAGLGFDAGGARVDRLTEAVTIIKGLLSGERVTFAGRHYRVTGHTIHPLPVQRPHPPIAISGNGRRLLALAAREADIVGLSGITFRRGGTAPDPSGWRASGVDERVQLVREIAGDRSSKLELRVALVNARLIEVQLRFTQLFVSMAVALPILTVSIGLFAWAANPNKDIGKEFDQPIEQDLKLSSGDRAILSRARIETRCLNQPARLLILRERAAQLADGVLLSGDCRPIRVLVTRDGHIGDAK